ncbi:MAG: DUF4402 domain-containing protein [Pseudomonadota bacterium]
MTKQFRSASNGLKFAVLALAIAGAGSAQAATANATSTSTVVAPINISKTADLSFGSFAAGAAPGSVTVSPNNTRGVSGGVIAMGGTATAAQFNVTGEAGSGYVVTLGGSTELTSGGNTMPFTPVSDFTASSITTGNVTTSTLTGGAQTIYVGGVLSVAANQAAGEYTGTVTATVEYQ